METQTVSNFFNFLNSSNLRTEPRSEPEKPMLSLHCDVSILVLESSLNHFYLLKLVHIVVKVIRAEMLNY